MQSLKHWLKIRGYGLWCWLQTLPYHLKFWLKTALYRWTPGGYGYYRYLRHYYDPTYVHQRDKHPVRHKHHGNEGWGEQAQPIAYRGYADYDEYVTHQKQKLEEILKLNGGFDNRTVAEYRRKFYHRFKRLSVLLPRMARIVCAGARLGIEVEVLQDLGFKNAYGIDLNPGPDNPFVKIGDFMQMDYNTSSIDLLYTNCVDHVFNLEQFFGEHARVIKPDGYVFYELDSRSSERTDPFAAVTWSSDEEIFLMMLRYFKNVVWVQRDGAWKLIMLQGKK
jgi:SAM-dependent methyltransferase